MLEIIEDIIQTIIKVLDTPTITSIMAVAISFITYKSQKKHNQNSVRPILDIIFGDYEDDIFVKVVNNGVGPGIIRSVEFKKGTEEEGSLIALMPKKIMVKIDGRTVEAELQEYVTFMEEVDGRAIPPGGEILFLRYQPEGKYDLYGIRKALSDIMVTIRYTDIYEKKTWEAKRMFDFFGRLIGK